MRSVNPCVFLLLALLSSCVRPPDVHPFTQATSDMGVAIDGSLKQVATDLKETDKLSTLSENQQKKLRDYQAEMNERAAKFTVVAHSFDEYAKALEQVAAIGAKREAGIKKVSDATKQLVEASKDFVAPYAAVLGTLTSALTSAVDNLNRMHTANELTKLASPQQEEVIQLTAQLLSAGLAQFAKVDAGAYNLLRDNRPASYEDVEAYYGEAKKRQQVALFLLSKIVNAEKLMLNGQYALLTSSRAKKDSNQGGPVDVIIFNDKDAQRAVAKAFAAFATASRNPDEVDKVAAAHSRLFTALRQRELYYLKLTELPQALYDAKQAQWNAEFSIPQQQSLALLQKSRQLIDVWAGSHHELRLLLLKTRQVSRQDLIAQAQKVQQLIADLNAVKEAQAAKKANEAKEPEEANPTETATN